jgi:hypothetical protein
MIKRCKSSRIAILQNCGSPLVFKLPINFLLMNSQDNMNAIELQLVVDEKFAGHQNARFCIKGNPLLR